MKQENKTVKQWLETLPEPIRSKALANTDFNFVSLSLKDALCTAFGWNESTEGWNYWSDIHTRALAGEFTKEQQPVSEPRTYTPEQVEEERRKAFVAGWMEYAGSFADEQANEAYETWAAENPIT